MLPAERLPSLVAAVDLDGVDELLRALDGTQRSAARRWFEGSRAEFRNLHQELYQRLEDGDSDFRLDRDATLTWVEGLCAVALLGPVAAARRVPWRDLWDYRTLPGEDSFVHLLWDAEPDWVAAFADAASRVSLGGNGRNSNGTLSRVLRAAVLHHALPCPSGPTFLSAWLAGAWRGSLIDTLRQDPLMPDLLLHYLASGSAGSTPELPAVTRLLVDEGRVDRERVVEVVLEQLTTAHRVASQRVLAGLLGALEVKAPEVPGGLAYLLGVLSTSHGSVGVVVLPLALELVDDAAGLAELAAVIGGRSERRQKELLLRALQSRELRDRVGDASVSEALRTLRDGDDDVAFVAKVDKARAALGGVEPDQPKTPLGLWAQVPTAPPEAPPEQPSFRRRDLRSMWRLLLITNRPSHEGTESDVRDLALWEVGCGRLDVTVLRQEARRLLVTGELSAPRAARLFEDLFLAGAMSHTWHTALTIADEASARTPKPARLDVLLRTLVTYAAEAPRQELPPGLRALAKNGSSKAGQEARALGAALQGVASEACEPASRGLWHESGPFRPLPSEQPVAPLSRTGVDLAAFEEAVNADYGHTFGYLGYLAEGESLARRDLLLRDAVVAIRQHGPDAVRTRMAGLRDTGLAGIGPVRRALELWAAGQLDVARFWTEALEPEPPGEQDRWGNGAAARVTFLRCCETLLRVGSLRALLSTPTYEDGTLDFDRLLARLAASAEGGVGPLDLVQALYRLRPTDPARVGELDLPPVPVVAALASPTGDTRWDAVETVRTWVAAGGLPPLDARPSADGSSWEFHGTPPVPWDVCVAAPPIPSTGDERDTGPRARVFPLQPDRTLSVPFLASVTDPRLVSVLTRMGGTFGLPVHDYVLAALSRTNAYAHKPSLDAVLELLAHDRLEPALLAQAALGRAAAGTLALPGVALSFEELFVSGGLARAWPLACAVADAVRGIEPEGLAALEALLARYQQEVPA